MQSVIGALRVILSLDSAAFEKGINGARASLARTGKSMQSVGKSMSLAVSAPLAALGVSVLKTAGDFEASMSRLSAATSATGDELSKMEKLARDLGKSTIFSALEASNAMETLAKNGLSVEQVLGGAAQASLNLAAATGGDMASAADLATDVMLSFGKEAKDLGPVVDGITGALLASKFGFDDYRLAMGQAGGVAGGLGVSFEDMNVALVATSNLFASGSDAGTSFKTFLTSLVPKSDDAAAAMEELGLEFFDAQGNMKGMEAIAEELRTGLGGLSDAARTNALTDIFGRDAMRTAIGLADTTAEKFREIQSTIANTSGAEQAAARLGPFANAMEQLSGAFDELKISIAQSGLLEFVTQMVTKITEWVDVLSESNPALLKWGTVIAGVGIALGPVLVALGLMLTAVAAISAPVLAVVAAVAALTTALITFWPEISAAGKAVNEFLFSLGEEAKAKVASFGQAVAAFATELVAIFTALPAQMMELGGQIIDGLWNGLKSKFTAVKDSLTGFASGLVGSVKDTLGIHSPSKVMHEVGTNVMQGLHDGMSEAESGIGQLAKSIGSTITSAFKGVIDGSKGVKEAISEVLQSLASMLADQAFKSLISGVGGIGGGGGFLGGIIGGIGNLFGFANGGSFEVGGAGGIDSQVVAFRASPNETVDVRKPGQERAGGSQEITVKGVFVDDNGVIKARVDTMGQQAAQAGAAIGVRQVNRTLPNMIASAQSRQM